MEKRIYAADDEANIRNIVELFLKKEGYEVETFETGDALLEAFRKNPSDMVILDVMMPGSDGFAVCATIRQISHVPIIMLTARDSDTDYVSGIALGSDDYFTKPFSPMALVMRVKAIFRRIEMDKKEYTETNREIAFEDITININSKRVVCGGGVLELTPNEYSLLTYLVENKERAIPREELLDKIWGYNSAVETRVADDTVKRLRKKIVDSSTVIETVWGYGFRLKGKTA